MLFEAKLGGRKAVISDNEKSCVVKNIQSDIDSGKFDFNDYGLDITFIDVGACLGMVSMHVSRMRRRWSIISIEPHPENYWRMLNNLNHNGEHALTLPFAIWKDFGRFTMVRNDSNSGGATINSKFCFDEDKDHPQVEVLAVPLNFIFENFVMGEGKVVIKMDIEGSEHDAFHNFKYWDRVVCLHLECHTNNNRRERDLSNEKLISEISSKFKGDFIHSSIEMGE
jgi:FkbM family methyltransferase